MSASVAADLRGVFNSGDLSHAGDRLARLVLKYGNTTPHMETAIPAGLTAPHALKATPDRQHTTV